MTNRIKLLALASIFALASTTMARADALHGFCWGGAVCVDNGSNTPTIYNPPKFGFLASPTTLSGTFQIDILIPNDVTFGATSIGVQLYDNSSDTTATLSSAVLKPGTWTTGQLDAFLGLGTTNPTNPIGAYIPDPLDPGATGFHVYQDVLGSGFTLDGSGPLLTLTSNIPVGSYIVGFLIPGVGTANSGAILEGGTTPPPAVPEPSSLILLGTGIVGVAGAIRRRFASSFNN